jgi:GT2 family glycosyltransferase
VPARLLRHRVNRGLGAARNTALEHARGEFVLFLDDDNLLYPTAIAKLLGALEEDPEAVLAYGNLAMFGDGGAVGLRSYQPWRPDRFRSGNFVDALALVRRDWLDAVGGFTTDVRLHGWEDYDLWCRAATDGRHGVFVPEMVARYRSAPHSMLSLTDLSTRQAVGVLVERHPTLFAGVELPL